MKDVIAEEPPIHAIDTLILDQEKADLVAHEIIIATGSEQSTN